MAALAFSIVALALVLQRVDLRALWQALLHVQIRWFIAANLLFVIAFTLAALRWHLILRLNHSLVHCGATLRMVIIGHFLNTLLLGAAGGDLAKTMLYSRWFGYATAPVLSTCVLDRSAGGVGFLMFASLTPILGTLGGHAAQNVFWASRHRILVVTAVAVLFIVAIALVRRWRKRTSPVIRFLDALRANAAQLLAHPGVALRAVLMGFVGHVCMSSLLLLCLQGIRPFAPLELLWIFPAITVITAAPITFAGTGLREGAALVLLGMYASPRLTPWPQRCWSWQST